MKRYLWGFPGIGKSSLDIPGLKIVDADSRAFEFKDVSNTDLHGEAIRSFERDDFYPQNYLDYIQSVDADIVLINCHPSLLDVIDKEDVLLVYPSQWLLTEYFHRYVNRGDEDGFIAYMVAEASGMIQYLNAMDYEKYQVFTFDTYLSDLFERKDFKMKLMTRQDIINALERAMSFKVIDADAERGELVCSLEFVADVPSEHRISDAAVWAEAVIDGKYSLDIDRLNEVCAAREDELKAEREALIEDLERAINLNVLDTSKYNNEIICDISFANDGIASADVHDAYDLADAVMSGEYTVDIDELRAVCKMREDQLVELDLAELRGGLSRQELADKIMQGIVNGALGIEYDQIAPYSHGYEVTFGGDGELGSTRKFKNRWECYRCDFFDVPGKIVNMIENEQQDGRVYGANAQPLDIRELIAAIDEMEDKQITSFVLAKDSGLEKRGRYSGHVASVMDVHKGLALDGIVQHYYHGDYSSMTPSRQNDLVETLVFMKGFCLDCLDRFQPRDDKVNIINYLGKRGIDISSPAKLQEWIQANPEKCGKEENRVRALSFARKKELYEQAFKNVKELNTIVNEFSGSFEDLCTKLGGYNWDGELFDLNYGVVTATVNNEDGVKFSLNQASIDIWDDTLEHMLEECMSVRELKVICKQYGVEVDDKINFNREGYVFNDEQMLYAQAYCDFVELKTLVEDYGRSFNTLCDRLGGAKFDDDTFNLSYGVVTVSIGRDGSDLFICESAIGVWDETNDAFVNDCISFKGLKETCEEIGFDVKQLEAEAMTVLRTEKPSLSAQIEAGASIAGGKASNKDKNIDIKREDER